MQPVVNSSLNIIIDADSAVSEKVLLDTVAEKEVMDRVEVSCYNNMKKRKKKKNEEITKDCSAKIIIYMSYRISWSRKRNGRNIRISVNIARKHFANQVIS